MSWASSRNTTRIEDLAYSLLGIFGINMPLLYGEGSKAFIRLQEEILRVIGDVTILAWEYQPGERLLEDDRLFAPSPKHFSACTAFTRTRSPSWSDAVEVTPKDIRLRLRAVGIITDGKAGKKAVLPCYSRKAPNLRLALSVHEYTDVHGSQVDVGYYVDPHQRLHRIPWLEVILPSASLTSLLITRKELRTTPELSMTLDLDPCPSVSLHFTDCFPGTYHEQQTVFWTDVAGAEDFLGVVRIFSRRGSVLLGCSLQCPTSSGDLYVGRVVFLQDGPLDEAWNTLNGANGQLLGLSIGSCSVAMLPGLKMEATCQIDSFERVAIFAKVTSQVEEESTSRGQYQTIPTNTPSFASDGSKAERRLGYDGSSVHGGSGTTELHHSTSLPSSPVLANFDSAYSRLPVPKFMSSQGSDTLSKEAYGHQHQDITQPRQMIADPDLQRRSKAFTYTNTRTLYDHESLSPTYRRKDKPRKFFIVGRVFMVLWTEPVGESNAAVVNFANNRAMSQTSYGEMIYTKVRRFVVVREGETFCTALPILTYGKRGVAKPGVTKSDHAIIYTGREPPALLPGEHPSRGEQGIRPLAIRVDPDTPGDVLDSTSRINLAQIYTVPHNVKVKSCGKVNPNSMSALKSQFNDVFTGSLSSSLGGQPTLGKAAGSSSDSRSLADNASRLANVQESQRSTAQNQAVRGETSQRQGVENDVNDEVVEEEDSDTDREGSSGDERYQ